MWIKWHYLMEYTVQRRYTLSLQKDKKKCKLWLMKKNLIAFITIIFVVTRRFRDLNRRVRKIKENENEDLFVVLCISRQNSVMIHLNSVSLTRHDIMYTYIYAEYIYAYYDIIRHLKSATLLRLSWALFHVIISSFYHV